MPHNSDYKAASSRMKSEQSKYEIRSKSATVKKAVSVAVAQTKVNKAKAAHKAAHAKLSPRQSILGRALKNLSKFRKTLSGDSARTTQIGKISGAKTDSQARASKRKRY